MPMYNLLGYSLNYSDLTGSFWFYSRDIATNFNADIVNTNAFNSFEYKAKLLGNIVAQPAPNQNNGILKKCSNCRAIKISKQFLEIFRNGIE